MPSNTEKKANPSDCFALDLAELRKGPVIFEKAIPTGLLAEKLKYCEYEASVESGYAKVKAEPCGTGVLVSGNIEASIRTQCGTCLADVFLHLTPTVKTYLFPRSEMEDSFEEQELTPEDLDKEWFEGDKIGLDGLILDSVMLEMPMNPKCSDACVGLPVRAASKPVAEIDPRLAPLAAFRIKKEK